MAAEPMTVHDLRERVESIAMALEEGQAALKRASEQAESLSDDELSGVPQRPPEIVRFESQIQIMLDDLVSDLKGLGDGSDFDQVEQIARVYVRSSMSDLKAVSDTAWPGLAALEAVAARIAARWPSPTDKVPRPKLTLIQGGGRDA